MSKLPKHIVDIIDADNNHIDILKKTMNTTAQMVKKPKDPLKPITIASRKSKKSKPKSKSKRKDCGCA